VVPSAALATPGNPTTDATETIATIARLPAEAEGLAWVAPPVAVAASGMDWVSRVPFGVFIFIGR
jgi:hypothetical protein